MTSARKPYPSDVSDEEWTLVAPYLTFLPEEAGQREQSLREVFNGLRYIIKTGAPWAALYQQAQRWLNAGCFEELAHDLRAVLRLAAGRDEKPSAAVLEQPHTALHARERRSRRLRWRQAQEAFGSRHPRASAGGPCHARHGR